MSFSTGKVIPFCFTRSATAGAPGLTMVARRTQRVIDAPVRCGPRRGRTDGLPLRRAFGNGSGPGAGGGGELHHAGSVRVVEPHVPQARLAGPHVVAAVLRF